MPGETSYDSGYNYADQINWGKSDLSAPLPRIADRPAMVPITPLPDNPSAEQLAKFDRENLAANTARITGRRQMLDSLTRAGPVGYQKTYLVNPYNTLENLGYNLNHTAPSRYIPGPMNTWGYINSSQNTPPPGQNTPPPGGPGTGWSNPNPTTPPGGPGTGWSNPNPPPTGEAPATPPAVPYVPASGSYWGDRIQDRVDQGVDLTAPATPGTQMWYHNQAVRDPNEVIRTPQEELARRLALRGITPPTTTTPPPTTTTPPPTTTTPPPTTPPPPPTTTGSTYWQNRARQRANQPATAFANGGVVGYAKGGIADIAAQGRNGDSMLVHMTPEEVNGLASLASANGRPLTTNPTTGLPEAFRLKDWLVPAAMIGAGLLLPGAGTAAAGAALGGAGGAAGAGAAAAGSLSAGMAMGASAVTGAGVTAAAGAAGAAGALGGAAATGSGIAGLGSTAASVMSSPLAQAGLPAAIKYAQTGDLGQAAAAGAMGWGTGQLMGNLAGTGADAAASAAAPAANPITMPMDPSLAMPPPDMASVMGASTAPPVPGAGMNFDQMVGATPSTLTSPVPDAYGSMLTPPTVYAPPPPEPTMMGRISDIGGGIKQAVSSQDALGQFAKENKTAGMALMGGAMASKTMAQGQAMEEANDARKAKDANERKRVERRIASTYAAQGRAQPHFTRTFAEGGITSQVDGRFLRGEGDGMSDSIPALLNGNQPAALTDGEFVIPADVVSNLGNGSSEAGAEQLYAMMDRIRQARTGTTKQAKAITPKRMLPA